MTAQEAYEAAQAGEFIAYDYDRQTWLTGVEARSIAARQAGETIVLLESEQGEDFARLCGQNREAMLEIARRSLAEAAGGMP